MLLFWQIVRVQLYSEQFKGLMAHMCLMIQLAKDLGRMVWLQYDREFRIWAAAKGVKVWGELNLSIYGRCLAAHQRPFSTNIYHGKNLSLNNYCSIC